MTAGSPTSLLCEAQSYPPALVTWLRDGSPFESGRDARVLPGDWTPTAAMALAGEARELTVVSVLSPPAGRRTLQILSAKVEDAGRYTCVASNEAGDTLKHYQLKVLGENPSSA